MCCTLTLNGEIAPQFTNFSLIDQMNQQLDSRADYYGSPLPRVAIAPSHTAPSQWRSSFLVDCTVEICLLLPIFAHLILNDPLRNARGNRGNRHFLTRPAREFFYHESPSIESTVQSLFFWKYDWLKKSYKAFWHLGDNMNHRDEWRKIHICQFYFTYLD